MENKDFLKKYPLQYSLPKEEAEALRKVLLKAGQSHAIEVVEELGVNTQSLQYYDFFITCRTTGFAEAYAHIGSQYAQHVLPIWERRHNK